VIPIVTPDEMAAVDRAASEPVSVLIDRAGYAVAASARSVMGGAYGRRVLVVAGAGNNGADGRVAAEILRRWGASVAVVDAAVLAPGSPLAGRDPIDLVVDAAYGTGLNREYLPPDPGPASVLAVDIPSGLSGWTGEGTAMAATCTVTFQALKPGLLLGSGPDLTGAVHVADIGLGALTSATAHTWLVTDSDVSSHLTPKPRQSHKWLTAVEVIGGSPSMHGAPLLVARSAMRAGAGYTLVGVPGSDNGGGLPAGEQVGLPLGATGWDVAADQAARRVKAIAVGPGLGDAAYGVAGQPGPDTPVWKFLVAESARSVPAVVDADGLTALGDLAGVARVAGAREAATVITPHEGEFRRLAGRAPRPDRITDVRDCAGQTGAVVLLKGSPTLVAGPDGRVLVVTSGSTRLATAGSGDALTGVIAAFMARGVPALEAAALGAHVHGRAAGLGREEGLVASDLADLVSDWLSEALR
jgi:NAD(P)H-hydrate epimerase